MFILTISVKWLLLLLLLQDLIKDHLLNLVVLLHLVEVLIFSLFIIEFLLGKVSLLNCFMKFINGQVSMPIVCIFKSFDLDLLAGFIVIFNDINRVLYCFS